MATRSLFDQLGNQVSLSSPPQRIISLVPSQTELLYDLCLDEEIVGITKFCVHPTHWLKQKPSIGGTKKFHFDIIESLNPDLIIGNKEENYKEGIERLQEKYPVWLSDITSMEDATEMIQKVGALTNKEEEAGRIIDEITRSFEKLAVRPAKRVLYLIWRQPWMAVGTETFIHSMLSRLGLVNCLENEPRYPRLSNSDIASLDPDLVFLSSEPYPFTEKHRDELSTILPSANIVLVDGEMFSWYGSRLTKAPDYFNSLAL